jgi:hypothetical protein
VAGYEERLHVPWWWWLAGGLLVLSVFIVYLVWTPFGVAIGVGGTLTVLFALGVWRYGAARIRVDEAGLHAGRTTLLADAIGEVQAIDEAGRRRLLGPEADARAHVLVRGFVPGGVYVQVVDAASPAPYWFVSSRRPEKLAAALTRAQAAR